jgi:hypothetical protein
MTGDVEKNGRNESNERIHCGLRLKKRERFFLWNSIISEEEEEKQIKNMTSPKLNA